MFDNLVVFENRYNEINEKLYDPDIVSDQKLYAELMKELKNITPIVEKYKEYQKASTAEAEAKEMLDAGGLDKDFREMVEQELNDSRKQLEVIADELKILLLPKDPNDDRNVIVEIRGGAGVKRLLCSQAYCFVCTACMPNPKAGKWKCSTPMKQSLAAIKKSAL